MSKRSTFTTISPLPPSVSRELALKFVQNHEEMIDLNPLVIERHKISPPDSAPEDERHCEWWSLTDKIEYLPGGLAKGDISYTCCFNDLRNGMQTHCYAPAGTDIRSRWTVNGTLPGEKAEPLELGLQALGAPVSGLYLREDVELRCNFIMSAFVKKTLKKSHATLVDTMAQKAKNLSSVEVTPFVGGQRTYGDSGDDSGSDRSSSVPPYQRDAPDYLTPSMTNSTVSSQKQQYVAPMAQFAPPERPVGNVGPRGDATMGHWASRNPVAMQSTESWGSAQYGQPPQPPSWTANDKRGQLPSQARSGSSQGANNTQPPYDPYAPKPNGGPGSGHVAELA